MGMKKILRQSPHSSPKSREKFGQLEPSFACKDTGLRIAFLEYRAKREANYQEKRLLFVSGQRDVFFPSGTWYKHIRDGCERTRYGPSFWERSYLGKT